VSARNLSGVIANKMPADKHLARRMRKVLVNAHLEGDSRTISYFRWINQQSAFGLLTAEFASTIDTEQIDAPFLRELERLKGDATAVERLLAIDERFFLIDHNLNYTDKLSMAAGVEVRVPFLAPGVLDLAHQLSNDQLVKGRQTKWALREAVRGLIPDEVIDRPKAGFGVPLRSWMKGPLAPWLADQLSEERLRRRGIFDVLAVRDMVKRNASGQVDASYTLLAIAFVERWLQLFVDNEPKFCSISRPPAPEWERVV
jgi:asparagine synthase (glutamine-hydrolysing)